MSSAQSPTGSAPRYSLVKFPTNLRDIDRRSCHENSIFDFLVLPETAEQEGLFPIGELSLIAGASGSWKTTVILDFINRWSRNDRFFERQTCTGNGKYLIVSFDRSENGFARTALRMGFDPNEFRLVQLGADEYSDRDPRSIIEAILTQDDFRGIRFLIVEGIDLKVGDVDVAAATGKTRKTGAGLGDAHLVSKVMRGLHKLAREHGFALLASIGSPKQKSSDKYSAKRDQIIGSQAWARMAETIIHLEPETESEEQDSNRRLLSILPRNGQDEVIPIMLDANKRPTRAPEKSPQQKGALGQILSWLYSEQSGLKSGEVFSVNKVHTALPDLKYDTVAKALQRMAESPDPHFTALGHGKYQLRAAEPDMFKDRI